MAGLVKALIAGFALIVSTPASAQLKDGEYHAALNGVRHWYRVAGAEHHTTPVVIVHGGPGGNVYAFEHGIGPRLERFATVVYYDQRGSGRSEAPANDKDYGIDLLTADLDALRSELKFDKVTLLGYSFGGELALEYALGHPGRLDRLILQSSSNGDPARTAKYQAYGFAVHAKGDRQAKLGALAVAPVGNASDHFEKVWDGASRTDVARFLFQSQEAADLNNRLNDESRKHGSRPNSGKMEKVVWGGPPRNPSLLSELSKIAVPTLVMVGLYDRNVGADSNREIAEAIPHAQLVIFEKSAHFPDMEEPEKYAETVRRFLQPAAKDR